ncbi:Fic family protein [Candidatus Woesearchaeota archaeon]|nr:Fic family protein [Candidatus Woesearchaeota archaeon]
MQIVQKRGYYYLGHSFRKSGRPTYREIYLGKTVPNDIELTKEAFLRKILNEEAFVKLEKIRKSFKEQWKRYPETIKKKILLDFSIDFTYNTNAIEGSKITKEETQEILEKRISPNKPLPDILETIAHSKVFFSALNEKKELSGNLILKWHYELFKDTKPDIAGKIREYLVRVGDYRAPDWQDVPTLLKELFSWYCKNKKIMHPLELAARAHYKFEKIHPFGDGNGRVGRLIIAHILKNGGYPLLIIEYKRRKSYYHALSKTENDFVNYLIKRYLSRHKEFLRKP